MSLNVLTIDRDSALLGCMDEIVRARHAVSYLAESASEALEILVHHDIDAVLLAYPLPAGGRPPARYMGWEAGDEFELSRAIKRIRSETLVFWMTAWGREAVDRAVCEADVDGFVRKPFDSPELDAVLDALTAHIESR